MGVTGGLATMDRPESESPSAKPPATPNKIELAVATSSSCHRRIDFCFGTYRLGDLPALLSVW